VAGVAAGADLGERDAQFGDPVDREADERKADAPLLVVRVDREHVDLAAFRLTVDRVDDDHGEPDRAAIGFGDPDPVAFRAAGGLHDLRLDGRPVRVDAAVYLRAHDPRERLEHRLPGAQRELHHDVDVVRTQGADADRHGRPLPLEHREVAV
jgi:hypothetical protein